MHYPKVCSACGATRETDHYGHGDAAAPTRSDHGTSFARVLNGTPWKQKPLAPPRHRDDVVPFD